MLFSDYTVEQCYDEMFEASGDSRTATRALADKLNTMQDGDLTSRQRAADVTLRNMGITFNVYGHESGTEKIWPFDILPRIIDIDEWQQVEQGLRQRIYAVNLFLQDIYNDQKIVRDGVLPEHLVATSKTLRDSCRGLSPPQGVWCHVTGTDLVRNHDGQLYVLEDNLRCPSGVSYVLENREVMKRTFPQVFRGLPIHPVEDYAERLLETLLHVAPEHVTAPCVAVLTPGIYNSAYFEHSFLAQQMGAELVQGSDLVVSNRVVYMRTTDGLQRVDVIYRRIDDDFLDPQVFREDSLVGVPGLMDAYRAGNVALANAPGTGIADDKALYAYIPAIIKYYLNEDAILSNVPTYLCSDEKQCSHVLSHLHELVVKPTNESGGYGIVLGPQASHQELDEVAERIKADPRNYIAQPMLTLSTVPTLIDGKFEPRHVDLRPFILCGEDIYVMPGGLTRVALRKGSMIVNSSQGGGSKDTWVVGHAKSGSEQTTTLGADIRGEG